MTRFFLTSSIALCALLVSPAMAEEKKEPAAVIQKVGPKVMKESKTPPPAEVKKKDPTPVDEWVAAENAMIDKLSEEDSANIFIMRNKHSIIRAIGVVERDIGAAVDACSKANPDMKEKMQGRYKQWQDAVNPITKTAQKNLEAAIDAQKIVKPAEFKKVLKMNDKAFEYGDKLTVKKPVSSPEACNKLIQSMNGSEDEMVTLLRQTLLPESVIKSRAQKQAKEKAQ